MWSLQRKCLLDSLVRVSEKMSFGILLKYNVRRTLSFYICSTKRRDAKVVQYNLIFNKLDRAPPHKLKLRWIKIEQEKEIHTHFYYWYKIKWPILILLLLQRDLSWIDRSIDREREKDVLKWKCFLFFIFHFQKNEFNFNSINNQGKGTIIIMGVDSRISSYNYIQLT